MPAVARRERGLTLTECCVSLAIAALTREFPVYR